MRAAREHELVCLWYTKFSKWLTLSVSTVLYTKNAMVARYIPSSFGEGENTAGRRVSTTDICMTAAATVAIFCGLVLSFTLLSTGTGIVAANNETTIEGSPDLDVQAPENNFNAGADGTLELFVPNEGEVTTEGTHPQEARDRATQARSTQADITDTFDAPIRVDSGEQFLGTIESGETGGPAGFDIFVNSDAEPGEYEIEVTLNYTDATSVTYEYDDEGTLLFDEETEAVTETFNVSVVVDGEARFEVQELTDETQVDEMGDISVELENTGSEDITDAIVTADSTDQDIFFGSGGQSSETFVGEWEAGERKTVTYRTGTNGEAISKFYPIDFTIEYDDPDGDAQSQTLTRAIRPLPRQQYSVESVEHDISIGDNGILELDLQNRGPRNVTHSTVTVSANDPAVTFESSDGAAQTTTTSFVGDWDPGENETLRLRTGIDDDAIDRSYAIDVTVSARDREDNSLNDRTRQFSLEPLAQQRYRIDNVDHSVPVGDNGVLELTVTNTGPQNVTQASVEVSTNDQAIVFGDGAAGEPIQFEEVAFETGEGGAPSSEAFVGEWEVDETRTLVYQAGATSEALQRNYTIDMSVQSEDVDGSARTTRTRQFGFQPYGEQTFAIEMSDHDIRVGEDGDIYGTVTNTGDQTVENAVVIYDSDLPNVFPRDTQYAVGTLDPGEEAPFSFRIGLSEEAEPTPRIFELQTRYRNHEDEVRLDDAQDLLVDVQPKRDTFAFDPVEAQFEPGDTDTVEMTVENTRDERLTDIQIQLFTNSPLDSDDDEVFVRDLEPGESTTIAFEMSVGSNALAKDYSASLDVRYQDERGDTKLSGTYRVPVTVTETEESSFPLWLVGALAVLLLVAVVVFRTRLLTATESVGNRLGG